MRIHCMLPFFRKLKSVYGPARLLSFLRDEFTLAQESTQIEMQLFHDFSYEPNVAQEEESKQEKQT